MYPFSNNYCNSSFCFLSIVFLFSFSHLNAQTYVNQSWQMQGGSPSLTVDWSQTHTSSNGDVVVVGNTLNATQMTNIYIVKYDDGGNLLWDIEFNGAISGDDYGTGVTVDGLGNIFVSGVVSNNTNDGFDYVVLHYDDQGVLIWQYVYDAFGEDDISSDIALTSNGDIVVTGTSFKTGSLNDYLTLRVNGTGNLLWASRYNFNNLDDGAVSVEVVNSNTIVVTGGSQSTATSFDAATVTYDGNGNQISANRQNSLTISQANGLATDDLGNIYIAGFKDNASGNTDFFTTKMDSDLVIQWTKIHDEAGFNDAAADIIIDGAYNVFVTGNVINSTGTSNVKTIKYTSAGNQVWEKNFKPMDNQTIYTDIDMVMNEENDIGITCAKHLNGNTNVLTIVYDTDGNLKWRKEFSIINQEIPSQITAAPEGFNITGISGNSTREYFVVSYATYTRISDLVLDGNGNPTHIDNELIVDFSSSQINTTAVDDDDIRFGNLETFFKPTLVNEISNLVGEVVNVNEIKVTGIFSGLKTTKTTTVTRGGKTISMPHFWSTFLLEFPSGTNEENIASIFNSSSLVNHASLNILAELASSTNDSLYSSQHSLNSTVYDSGHINIEGAWDIETGASAVKVAILDAGVDWRHEDFKTINGHNVIKGGFHYKTDPPELYNANGINYYDGAIYHGTKVAGIIGAVRNNDSVGIAGIAGGNTGTGGVSLYSNTIGQLSGPIIALPLSWVEDAIFDAATEYDSNDAPFGLGVNIMNLSWVMAHSPILEKVIRYAYRNEVTIVASRGNFTNLNPNNIPLFPACYADNVVINVGGSDLYGKYWTEPNNPTYANGTGAMYDYGVDVTGPAQMYSNVANQSGRTIISTSSNGAQDSAMYAAFGGTSAAAAHVSGLAALMMSHVNFVYCPTSLSPEDVEYILEHNARDITASPADTGYDIYTGHGLIDATATMEAIEKPVYRIRHIEGEITINDFVADEGSFTTRFFDAANGAFTGISGSKPCKWHKYSITLTKTLDSNEVVLDNWLRRSATNSYDTIVAPNGHIYNKRDVESYTFSQSGNTVQATIEGYAYEVQVGGGTVWFPYELTDSIPLSIGFTVYSKDTTATSFSYDCDQVTSVKEINKDDSKQSSIYPNPSNEGFTRLNYSLHSPQNVSIKLYEGSGKLVASISDKKNVSGKHSEIIPTSNLNSGIYYVTVVCNEFSETHKFIITK